MTLVEGKNPADFNSMFGNFIGNRICVDGRLMQFHITRDEGGQQVDVQSVFRKLTVGGGTVKMRGSLLFGKTGKEEWYLVFGQHFLPNELSDRLTITRVGDNQWTIEPGAIVTLQLGLTGVNAERWAEGSMPFELTFDVAAEDACPDPLPESLQEGGGGSLTQYTFLRGDCTGDSNVDLSDAVCALNWLFRETAMPGCIAALNTNGDADVNITDAVSLLNFLFAGGPAPVAPFPDCGPAAFEADEVLRCANAPNCEVAQ